MGKRTLLKLILLFSLMLILSVPAFTQGNAISGSINNGSDCTPFSLSAHYPAHAVTFTVTTSGNYSFSNVANDYNPPTAGAWFYIFAGTYDPLVPYAFQASYLGEGFPGSPLNVNLATGITYIMVTNNDQRFADRTTCLNRINTVAGNYVQGVSGAGAICTGGSCVGNHPLVSGNISTQSLCPIFFDGRINNCDTFNPVVLYGYQDENDNWGLDIYGANGEGLMLRVTPEEIADVAECPDSNSTIIYDNATDIGLYRLSKGSNRICPFQLNAPTSDGSKTYVIIFDSLYQNSYYESWEESFGE